MKPTTLLKRNLLYHWRLNLAVVLGVAVGTAVLTGALLVGDSIQGSLRSLTLDRLGRVDHALVSDRFFRQAISTQLEDFPEFKNLFESSTPAIVLRGTLIAADSRRRSSQVRVWGVANQFWTLGREPIDEFPQGRELTLNDTLARELEVQPGDALIVRVTRPSTVPREAVLGRRTDTVQTLRLTLKAILPDRGLGRFGFEANQQLPRNVFLPLETFQRALDQEQHINAIFVSGKQDPASQTESAAGQLQEMLAQTLTLEDLGLSEKLHESGDYFYLESRELVLRPALARVAEEAAREIESKTSGVFTYLANRISAGTRTVPYSTVSGIDITESSPFGSLQMTDGTPAPALGDDEILLNQWAARNLEVRPGDRIDLEYFVVGTSGQLLTSRSSLRLRGVVRLSGLGADPSLTPDFPGIHGAMNIVDWDPPFPLDLSLVRPRDEAYWDRYRAAPKAFVALKTARKLWTSRFGSLTSLRVAPDSDMNLGEAAEGFRRRLLGTLRPEQSGLAFQPVKFQGLAATKGSTDFGMLFAGFTMFLIISAALWVALLIRFSIERRAREIGILMATGITPSFVRRLFLAEGAALTLTGGMVGLLGAAGYAWVMVYGLRNWWQEAIGSPFVELHITGTSLIAGFVAALSVIFISIWLALRQLGKTAPRALLAGSAAPSVEVETKRRRSRTPWLTGALASALAVGLAVVSLLTEAIPTLITFFVSGVALLVAALAFFTATLYRKQGGMIRGRGPLALARLGARNASRSPGRSILTAGLVASASFVIVTVALNRQDVSAELPKKDSGNGGFSLVAETDLALHYDLSTREGRRELYVPESAEEVLRQAQIFPFRLRPGEDVSCLNLFQPTRPRLLGVPSKVVARGGFAFQGSLADSSEEEANPWLLLEKQMPEGVVPAIGDYNTVMWILHLGLGKEMTLSDEHGQPVRLQIVGLLKRSVFQSELLISESHFLNLFPSQSGYPFFMVETPTASTHQVAQVLEEHLAEWGLDVITTSDRLASYLVVENTYLSTFLALGGLGLMLGTLGLATLILRNVVERRGELALLVALGFRRKTLGWLLLAENGFLLLFGLSAGSLSALVAVGPHLAESGAHLPWASLRLTLLLVCATGLTAGTLAAGLMLRTPLLPALRSE